MPKKLICSNCFDHLPYNSFSSREKTKLNKRICTSCVIRRRKDRQKRNRKEIFQIVNQQAAFDLEEIERSPSLQEINRREKERKKLTSNFHTKIIKRDNRVCHYCNDNGNTVDHKTPIIRGGETSYENCVCACSFCNNLKGHLTYIRFQELIGSFSLIEWNQMKHKFSDKNP